MKYKALITGNNDDMIDDFFSNMDQMESMTTSKRYNDVVKHLKYFAPDILVYCIYQETKEDYSKIVPIKHLLSKNKLPFVVVGSEEDCADFERITANIADLIIQKTLDADTIQEKLSAFLKEWQEKEKKQAPESQPAPSGQETPAPAAEQVPPVPAAGPTPSGQEIPTPAAGPMPTGQETPTPMAGPMPTGQVPPMPTGPMPTGQIPPMPTGSMPAGQVPPMPMGPVPMMQGAGPMMGQMSPMSSAARKKPSSSKTESKPAASKVGEKKQQGGKAAPAPRRRRRHRAMGKGRILVVDDNPLMLKVIKEHLHEEYDVATATSGKVAFRFLEHRQVDLILLDYEMPEEDGPSILKKLRADDKTADVPVVFLTGISDRKKIQKALMLQPDGYLLKPIDYEKLISTIKQYID